MILHGKTYDALKQIAQIWLPALATLYGVLTPLWSLPYSVAVIGTIAGIDTFLGTILQLSANAYNNSDAKYDGEFVVDHGPEGEQHLRLKSIDYNAINTKSDLLFKLHDPGPPAPAPSE